jgi:hypothetical protein
MRIKFLSLSAFVLTCMVLILVSCKSFSIGAGSGQRHKHGPPPHAPAHGYRHKHNGIELVYDSGRGVYVVIGIPHHYYFKGHYYRLRETTWEMGIHIDGQWEFVSENSLPKGLRAKQKGKDKSKEHPGRGLGLEKKK